VLGRIAEAAGATITGSAVQTVFGRLGAPGTGAEAFLGVSFLIVAVLVAFLAAGLVLAARDEEGEGRLEHLIVRPVSRLSWLAGRATVAVVAVLVGGLIAGLMTWLGTVFENTGVSLATLVTAGFNVVPPALCLFGIGVLAFGVWPRGTSDAVYGVLGWSLLVEIVGGVGANSRWLLDTSLFHQMAATPAVDPNWTASGIMIAIGAAGSLLGGLALQHRDIHSD
jgi:ABC-2 type transport system permease protein